MTTGRINQIANVVVGPPLPPRPPFPPSAQDETSETEGRRRERETRRSDGVCPVGSNGPGQDGIAIYYRLSATVDRNPRLTPHPPPRRQESSRPLKPLTLASIDQQHTSDTREKSARDEATKTGEAAYISLERTVH